MAELNPRSPSRPSGRYAALLVPAALLAVMLVPVYLALGELDQGALRLPLVVSTLGIFALLALLPSLMPMPLAVGLASLELALMLFVHLAYYGVVQLSGNGFTDEVFIHLEPRSFAVSWEQYRGLWLLLLGMLALLPGLVWWLLRIVPRVQARTGLLLALAMLVIVALTRQGLPQWMLVDAARTWYAPKLLDLPAAELQRWRSSSLIEVDLPKKSTIRATLAEPPRNLILVYLESVGQGVIEHPDYPGLMPNLSRRLQANGLLEDYFAASYITIEGITNSQCGTLFPFEGGSESLAGFDNLAEEQPCLGDVLQRAGYAQTYLGGADIGFAGKGHFLAAHGYDPVWGMEHWRELGFSQRPGGWGLGDPDLFEQALLELERLRAGGRPFNLTLLTIGTHLPGFTYAECTPYGSNEPFIEALNCTDQLLEHFLRRLETEGHLEDTLVVVTADHHVFPNPLMRRLFGDAAVWNKRLPLIILGAGSPAHAAVPAGAGYDLAPTLLELLGVEHTARFALGRSLLQAASARDYFPTRYMDVHDGDYRNGPAGDCSADPPELPLNRCEKAALKTVLRMQNAAFSLTAPVRLDCRIATPIRIRLPLAPDQGLEFLINGEDQAARFTWRSRLIDPARPGLYQTLFGPDGKLVERRFIPLDEPAALRTRVEPPDGHGLLLAWRLPGAPDLPDWLAQLGADVAAGALLLDADGHAVLLEGHDDGAVREFILDPAHCESLRHED